MLFNILRAIGAIALFSIAISSPALAQTGQAATPEAYGAIPAIMQAKISPDGQSIAVLSNLNGKPAVLIFDANALAEPPGHIGTGDLKPRRIEWGGNDYLLILASTAAEKRTSTGLQNLEFDRWISYSLKTNKARTLFGNEAGYYIESAGRLLATTPDDPDNAIFARWTPQAKVGTSGSYGYKSESTYDGGYTIFRTNLKSGNSKRIEPGEEDTAAWVVNADGEPLLRVDFDKATRQRKLYANDNGKGRLEQVAVIEEPRGQSATIYLYGSTGAPYEFYATTYGNGDKLKLVVYDTSKSQITRTVYADQNFDLDSVLYDSLKATVVGARYTDDLPQLLFLDDVLQKIQTNLAKALPGATPLIESRSIDDNKMIVKAVYPDRPSDFYVFDRAARKLDFFAPSRPGLAGNPLVSREKYDYTTDDGVNIRGYLTKPITASGENMPLIVLPHGGPEGRDTLEFDWWASFYAARGYTVYQPNFRGSDGYGFNFREAGFGEWGRKMQDDITNGVEKLVTEGVVDRDRICIAGASYGGYAALAGATLTPDLYACAVSVNGVADLETMLGHNAVQSELAADYWEKRIGSRFREMDEIKAVSPRHIADHAGAPIMLIHGKDDVVVPFYQSRNMRDALVSAGKPVEFIELEGEDHWLSGSQSRTEMLRQSINFIDRHIGN